MAQLERMDSGWSIPLGDGRIEQVAIDYAVTLVWDAAAVRISTPFTLTMGDKSWLIDPEKTDETFPVLAVLHTQIQSLVASDDGRLTMSFEGALIQVEPHQQWEAWDITESKSAHNGFRIVCTPGGELAVWTSPS